MMKSRIAFAATVWLLLAVAALPLGARAGDQPPRITKERLRTWLGDPAVSIIDARTESEWRGRAAKIPGAVRGDLRDVGSWANDYPKDRTLVVYCS